MSEITELLAVQEGRERPDLAAVFERLYADLKRIAIARVSALGPDETLSATGLVHEAYLKLVGAERLSLSNRKHFFACAARAMRHILVDAARAAMQVKAGGRHVRIPLSDPAVAALGSDPGQALALDAALHALADDDPRAARVVELHYFAGLGLEHVADIVGVNARTVERDWRYARAFLAARLPD